MAPKIALESNGQIDAAKSSARTEANAAQPLNEPTTTSASRIPTAATTGIHRAASRRRPAVSAPRLHASASARRSAQRTLLNAVTRDIFSSGSGSFVESMTAN